MIVGVDPGFSGAVALLDDSQQIMFAVDMPVLGEGKKKQLDELEIRELLREPGISHVYIEKSQTMPGQGISSSGRYMCSYGIVRGICVGLGLPYTLVHPKTWKKDMMRDMGKEKEASVIRVKQLYPDIKMPRKKDHGPCDAILIARYGLKQ